MIQEIRTMRAFAILAVVAIHTMASFTSCELTITTSLALIVDSAAHFAVPLFIFISGFVLTLKTYPIQVFYYRRFLKIIPVYIGISILYSIYYQKPIIDSILNFNAVDVLGFFKYIIALYLFYPVIIKFCRGWSALPIAFFIQVLFQSITLKIDFLNMIKPIFDPLTAMLFYFVLGIYVSQNYEKIKGIINSSPWIWLIPTFLTYWSLIIMSWLDRFYMLQVPSISFGSSMFVLFYIIEFILIFKWSINNKISTLDKIADHSFGIYLTHMIILEETKNLLIQAGIGPDLMIFYLIIFWITILMSYTVVWCWHSLVRLVKNSSP